MLVRQLQRPLTRSIAAAWRPAQCNSPVSGSARCRFSATPTEPKDAEPSSPPKLSLFAELFPDEAKQRLRLQQSKGQPHGVADHEPSVRLPSRTPSPLPQSAHPLISYYEDSSHHPASASASTCTVVLSAASKQLVQSDFYRVGAGRAAHVEGWVGGITKVMQARDPDTLEPLGRYYISFETAAAAASWREEVKRLWELSRLYTPGVVRRGGTKGTGNFAAGMPVAAKGLGKEGWHYGGGTVEDMEAVRRQVQGFTLVPPGMRWSLEVAKYTAEERAMEHAGSLVEKLCRKAGTKCLVLVVVRGGRITPETLRTAITDDGMQRGLAWRIKDLEARVGDDKFGIMPFGKSVLKAQDQISIEDRLRKQETKATGDEQESNVNMDADMDKMQGEARRYSRFLVPFLDEAEARRFVRNWHRRGLTLRLAHEDPTDQDVKESDQARLLNVSLLW